MAGIDRARTPENEDRARRTPDNEDRVREPVNDDRVREPGNPGNDERTRTPLGDSGERGPGPGALGAERGTGRDAEEARPGRTDPALGAPKAPAAAPAAPAEPHAAKAARTGTAGTSDPAGTSAELVPTAARDDLEGRLKHAVHGFVDEPRAAVEEADHVLEELTTRLTEALAGRRSTLRTSWQDSKEDTEHLRLALRDYRETAERLLKL
ncbi:hypothetical protein [Streptomyces sp. cg35]|uniref:hypothetical protein n=1 Tax=Streptomyces sp. cg35 TaxID=3421650 RepID=UPI003D182618